MSDTRQLRIIFDLDAMAFRACAAAERDCQWDNGVWSIWATENDILKAYESLCDDYMRMMRHHYGKEAVAAAEVVLAESIGANWRIAYEPTYKGTRRDTSKVNRKPVGYNWLLETVRRTSDVRHTKHYEGDDVIGILATSDTDKYRNVVVALDKDFLTIPCEFLRVNTEELVVISKQEAEMNLYHQTLVGDASDGYPGCKGVGAVSAAKILEGLTSQDAWYAVINEFTRVEMGLTPAAYKKVDKDTEAFDWAYRVGSVNALRQYTLARILKSTDECPIKQFNLTFN